MLRAYLCLILDCLLELGYGGVASELDGEREPLAWLARARLDRDGNHTVEIGC